MNLIKKPEVDPLDLLATQAATEQKLSDQGADGLPLDTEVIPAEMTNTKCLMLACEVVRETLCSFAKVTSPMTTMSNEVMQPVADSVGAVLDKYGINLASVGGDFMTEIKAVIVTLPVLISIRAGLQTEIKAKQEKTVQLESAPVE